MSSDAKLLGGLISRVMQAPNPVSVKGFQTIITTTFLERRRRKRVPGTSLAVPLISARKLTFVTQVRSAGLFGDLKGLISEHGSWTRGKS